jgi:para-aminobenzoate synthetase component 1
MVRERFKRLFVYDWQGPDAVSSFAPLAALPYSLFLDSARAGHALNRYSYILWHPYETIESKDGRVTITNAENQFTYHADMFKVVRERLALWGEGRKPGKGLPPFQGGAAGYFGYDLARQLEKLPSLAEEHGQPDACIGLYDNVLAFDHAQGKAVLMIAAESENDALVRKKMIADLIAGYREKPFESFEAQWSSEKSDADYAADIAKVIGYIHAGDIFQANLSRRFSAKIPTGFDAYRHYRRLREVNPAPYAAFMNFGDVKLASSSPERFLEVRGRMIETRPIKGTMPSSLPPSALSESAKDRAENVMIVDLLRNDLSRVCEDHSIEVSALCDIETFEGLHHMVSTVRGRLRGDREALDALRACFPGGSITGAPKIRAMEIIDELEPQRRGAYCGALVWAGYDGAMDSAITIRTLVYDGGQVHLQTGGGITAESIPEAELRETLVKADRIFASFSPSLRAQRSNRDWIAAPPAAPRNDGRGNA